MKTDEELLREFKELVEIYLATHTFEEISRLSFKAIQKCKTLDEAVLRAARVKEVSTGDLDFWFNAWLFDHRHTILRIMKNENR